MLNIKIMELPRLGWEIIYLVGQGLDSLGESLMSPMHHKPESQTLPIPIQQFRFRYLKRDILIHCHLD
jgi:hypothetical protein